MSDVVVYGNVSFVPWPRLMNNLRASFETDLWKAVPIHIAAAILGHSPKIGAKHYVTVSAEDVQAVLSAATPASPPSSEPAPAKQPAGTKQSTAADVARHHAHQSGLMGSIGEQGQEDEEPGENRPMPVIVEELAGDDLSSSGRHTPRTARRFFCTCRTIAESWHYQRPSVCQPFS